jgi:hypothetical protein
MMPAEWIRLTDDVHKTCASVSHDRPVPADWRMESGGVGSYYCETCRYMIARGKHYGGHKIQITTTPDN